MIQCNTLYLRASDVFEALISVLEEIIGSKIKVPETQCFWDFSLSHRSVKCSQFLHISNTIELVNYNDMGTAAGVPGATAKCYIIVWKQ